MVAPPEVIKTTMIQTATECPELPSRGDEPIYDCSIQTTIVVTITVEIIRRKYF